MLHSRSADSVSDMRRSVSRCLSLRLHFKHRTQMLVASFSISVDASLFLSSFFVAWRPRYVHFVQRNEFQRGVCRLGDVLLGRLSLFADQR